MLGKPAPIPKLLGSVVNGALRMGRCATAFAGCTLCGTNPKLCLDVGCSVGGSGAVIVSALMSPLFACGAADVGLGMNVRITSSVRCRILISFACA